MAKRHKLNVITWNVERPDHGLATVAELVSSHQEWDALLLQEVAEATRTHEQVEALLEGTLEKNHTVISNPHKPWDTAILLHKRWTGKRQKIVST